MKINVKNKNRIVSSDSHNVFWILSHDMCHKSSSLQGSQSGCFVQFYFRASESVEYMLEIYLKMLSIGLFRKVV